MDFPIFHLDFFGNRMLIAVIAILHVIINHGLAVGFIPLIATMELYAFKKKNKKLDNLAYKMMFVSFAITTTVGALTGVGVWFSAALVNPYSIASLIRVFFWAWFFEWIIFVTEVCLILWYFLSWKKCENDERKKLRHIYLGYSLAFFSWITMAVIVAILAFMMDPSSWLSDKTLLSGIFNNLYLPQLSFRTGLAMIEAGSIASFLVLLFTKKDLDLRARVMRGIGLWLIFWAPITLVGGYWYYCRVPAAMAEQIPLALLTGAFTDWSQMLLMIILGSTILFLIWGQVAILAPKIIPTPLALIPLITVVWLTGHFERVREFIRKPYIIGKYMYANTFRVGDYPLIKKDGILAHATYYQSLSDEEKGGITDEEIFKSVGDGKNIFLIACSRCHTHHGINGIIGKFTKLLGSGNWNPEDITQYTLNVHDVQAYMPPFPGNEKDARSLAMYLIQTRNQKNKLQGAQYGKVDINVY